MKTCKNYDKPARVKGLCPTCYGRAYRAGNVVKSQRVPGASRNAKLTFTLRGDELADKLRRLAAKADTSVSKYIGMLVEREKC